MTDPDPIIIAVNCAVCGGCPCACPGAVEMTEEQLTPSAEYPHPNDKGAT